MPSLDRTPEGWSVVADAYEDVVLPFTRAYAEDALRFVPAPAGGRVLDVACGPGTLALIAAERGARVVATDFSPAMVARLRHRVAERRLGNLEAHVMDGQALALPDGSFDAAYSIFGLIFFPDRARGFRELWRVLKPGGRAAVAAWSTPDRIQFFSVLQSAVREAVPDLEPPPEPPAILSLADPQRFRQEMEGAGFRRVEIRTVQHAWTHPSPEAFWERQLQVSPVFKLLVERIGPPKVARVRDVLLRRLHAEFGNGPVSLRGEAHVGLGAR